MIATANRIMLTNLRGSFSKFVRNLSQNPYIEVSEEVTSALEFGQPIVCLESTIITHGMPYPDNIKCASEVEDIIRTEGAVPATIAIINGKIKVGLSQSELLHLGDIKSSKPTKTSRRDMSYVISNKKNGGTTVSGTMIVANKVGIPIFATGGIGGVHRAVEKSFDISADLTELGKSNVAVISSGVKSILDIPKTLEYLETQGVFVASFSDTKDFPAFYSRISGCQAPYKVQTAIEAARIIKCNRDLNMQSGMLFAVPIPEMFALNVNLMNNVIEEAIKGAKKNLDVLGKQVTPYLLSKVSQLTGGKSLEANIALIKNNAEVAARIAVELSRLEKDKTNEEIDDGKKIKTNSNKKPVIIGGSNLDCSANLDTSDIKLDGRIHFGNFSYSAGGVARNMCEALLKLGCPTNFITAIGDDDQGRVMKRTIPKECRGCVKVLTNKHTAQCIVVLDSKGDCRFLMGDMKIHREITPKMIRCFEHDIKECPLLILDGNLTVESISVALELATRYNIPVLYEPTDVEISSKPFETPYWKAINFITPNLNELKHIAKFLEVPVRSDFNSKIEEASYVAEGLVNFIENIIVTLGSEGLLIARRGSACDSLLKTRQNCEISVRHYPVQEIKDFVNVSGAGDCLASGLIAATLNGLSEENSVSVGIAAAQSALHSPSAVPQKIFDNTHPSWKMSAFYKTII